MNYYEILQVREDASDEVIKMAYKALVKKYHPDTFLGDENIAEEMMKQINLAYEVLSNPQKRKEYDSFLSHQRNNQNEEKSKRYEENKEQSKQQKVNYKKYAFFILIILSVIFLLLPLFNKSDIESVKDSVVMIVTYDENNNEIGTGSGFCAYKSNYIVTNYHVIEGASKIDFITDDGAKHTISNILVFNRKNDLAILESFNYKLEPITVGNSNSINAGDKITAIGSPKGQLNTVSTGVISNADDDYEIRITAPISPGSSGGVLLNAKHKVIGITYASLDSDKAQNINYAINVNLLNEMYKCLKEDKYNLITESNYDEYYDEFHIDVITNDYYRIDTIKLLGLLTNFKLNFENSLENSFSDWYKIYDEFSDYQKDEAFDLYNQLKSRQFDKYNISNNVNTWDATDFFICLNVFTIEEYSVMFIDIMSASNNDEFIDKLNYYDIDYAVRLLVYDLLGDYEWETFTDEEQEEIFYYFDSYYWDDIEDMGSVLEFLGYYVEYEHDGTLTAYW